MYNLVRVRNSAPPAGVTTGPSSPRGSSQQAIREKSGVLGGLKFFYKEKNSGSKVKGGKIF